MGCGNRTVEDTTELDISVAVDNDPPVVKCTLGTQGLAGTGAGVFTDLAFSFTAIDGGDKCTEIDDLAVTIEVLSNEVVATGEEVSLFLLQFEHRLNVLTKYCSTFIQMVFISEPRATTGNILSIWAEDHTCKSAQNGQCKISSPKKSREYIVRVTATDKAGNVGEGECNTIVGKQGVASMDPSFLLAKLDITGGMPIISPTLRHHEPS